MAEKITFGDVVNATVQANNKADTKRLYDISANVTFENKKPTNINDGKVFTKDGDNQIGWFNGNAYGYLNIGFNNYKEADTTAVLDAVKEFIAALSDAASAVAAESII